MNVNLIVADNFYNDPDSVRSFALQQEFAVRGNYPGLRTRSFLNDSHKEVINALVSHAAGSVTDWLLDENGDGYTGAFQICTAKDRTWIHADSYNSWAAVCYLTPNAPLSAGTALYRYKETGDYFRVDNTAPHFDGYDYTKWDMVDYVANKYNRIVMYRGNLYHASLDYFGNNLENGRLFQTFFFNTEY